MTRNSSEDTTKMDDRLILGSSRIHHTAKARIRLSEDYLASMVAGGEVKLGGAHDGQASKQGKAHTRTPRTF